MQAEENHIHVTRVKANGLEIIIYFAFMLLALGCNKLGSTSFQEKIENILTLEARQADKLLQIQKLTVLDSQLIDSHLFDLARLKHLREIRSIYEESIELNVRWKELVNKNQKTKTYTFDSYDIQVKNDYERNATIISDSLILVREQDIEKINTTISNIMSNSYRYADEKIWKVTYFIQGQVNKKWLADTVVVYFSKDLEENMTFTNVLYTAED